MAKLDKQDQRITHIFGTQDVPEVDTETIARYLDHLRQHLALPCQLTGIEDFDWEEYYVIGPGSKAEHERLRKTRPSYMDTYDLLSFENEVDPDDGIMVQVRRVSDKKKRSYWIPGSSASLWPKNFLVFLRLLKSQDLQEEIVTQIG